MRFRDKIKAFFKKNTYGYISLAAFLIAIVSGIFIVVPYDVNDAYGSVAAMLIANPFATYFRNIHYWSAQIFLIFTFLHLWEHLKRNTSHGVKKGLWFRLVLSVPVVLFVMLTGFILKGDNDALQAKTILSNLISKVPFGGGMLSGFLIGTGKSLITVYVHHIATATIFLIFIIVEHSKTVWGKSRTVFITLITVLIISLFFGAPLNDNSGNIMKGPWYFAGLQELLHWLSNPGISVIIIFAVPALLYLAGIVRKGSSTVLKRVLLITFYIYGGLTVAGLFFRGENWEWRTPWDGNEYYASILEPAPVYFPAQWIDLPSNGIPEAAGRKEGCLVCHTKVTGLSPAHNPEAIGCVSCHGGNPFTLDKDRAHKKTRVIPGNIEDAPESCGTAKCHPDITHRVENTLMNTLSGMITVDKYVFGELDSLSSFNHVHNLGNSAADEHLRNLCVICHLGNAKTETGPVTALSRGGGCNACHLNYSEKAMLSHSLLQNAKKDTLPGTLVHPSLNLNITGDHCYGCHSRSGRISTNYEGWHETTLEPEKIPDTGNYKLSEDKRVYKYISGDVHHKAGLDCIDCHNSYETMGDGNRYAHQEQQVKIRCEDCHFINNPLTIPYNKLDGESKKTARLRGVDDTDRIFIMSRQQEKALINTFVTGDSAFLIGKISGKRYRLNSLSEKCFAGSAHENVSCSACHTAWAPRCIGCHNIYDSEEQGYDMVRNELKRGTWVEYAGENFAIPPTLGVLLQNGNNIVKPAIPGMILSIDKNSYYHSGTDTIFRRLFAPAEPHTVAKEGRGCKTCHNNPVAIGYGEGELKYETSNGTGHWIFIPLYQNSRFDGLPEDAWMPFDFEDKMNYFSNPYSHSTRDNFRPFSITEQKRILTVGACLTCHDENSEIMLNSLKTNFKEYLNKTSDKCVLPVFP